MELCTTTSDLAQTVLRNFCEALPADRLLLGNSYDLDEALAKERVHRTYTEPSTKAKLTYRSSLNILAHFVGTLVRHSYAHATSATDYQQPHDHESVLQATYIMTVENKQYVCEVLLPEVSPIRSVIGRPSSRKAIAKCSAAFEACLQLRKSKYLDSNLLPIFHKQLPAMRNAHLALNMKNTNAYEMRIKPSMWEETWGSVPEELYMTVLGLTNPECIERPSQPLVLLTRVPMFAFPSFPLYVKPGVSTDVVCKPMLHSIKITGPILNKLTRFTFCIYKDIFNKTYEEDEAQMSYWLAPLLDHGLANVDALRPQDLIDWKTLDSVNGHEDVSWVPEIPLEELADRYLIDRWDGGRRFFSVGVAPEFRPSDPVPEGCAPHKYMKTILDYTVSLFAKSRARATWRPDQPVVLAHRVLTRRNWLDDWSQSERDVKTVSYVCPEPLKFSAVRLPAVIVSSNTNVA